VDRLTNLISVFWVLGWRISWLTMLSPSVPRASAELAFSAIGIELPKRVAHDTPRNAQAPPLMRNVIRLGQLGGYLARANDPPPGNTVMWRAMRQLTDILLGYELALKRSE
jgi:hypothetical protein